MKKTLACLCLFLSGCVVNPRPSNSRYESDYTRFQPSTMHKNTLVYRHPTKRVLDFKSFLVEPVKVYPHPVKKVSRDDRAKFDAFAAQLTSRMTEVFQATYPLATAPGPGVLRMQTTIYDLKPIFKKLDDAGNQSTIFDDSRKGTKLEIRATDSVTGEEIYALATFFVGDEFNVAEDPSMFANVEKEFSDWTDLLQKLLEDAKKSREANQQR